jgi:hypothetical protein
MDREKLESMVIEYIDGTLDASDREKFEFLMETNMEASHLYHQTKMILEAMNRSSQLEPSATMKSRFENELQRLLKKKEARVISISQKMVYRIAAGIALILVSGAMFYWINKNVQQERQLAELKLEMEQHKQLMLAMIENQSSAGKRIQGVNVAYAMEKADDEIVKALVKALDEDPNTNVRLAALEALAKFHSQPHVRKALVESLSTQTDAVVQIELIRLLVAIKATQSLDELKRITTQDDVLPAVKDEAYAGIMRLS